MSGNLFNLLNIRLLRLTHTGTYQMCQTSEYFTSINTDSLIRELVKPFKYQGTCTCLQRLTCQGTDLTFQTCSYSNTSTNTCSLVICQILQTSGYFSTSTNTDSLVREHVKPFIHQGTLTYLQTQTHSSVCLTFQMSVYFDTYKNRLSHQGTGLMF